MSKTLTIAKDLDKQVKEFVGQTAIQGFEKAFMLAEATKVIKGMLTNEYMSPIMELQGTRLGFRTDKDAGGGYSQEVVKSCLIEAVLNGLQPVGNHFNIIGGNMYPTKEGLGYLLDHMKGLYWEIIPGLPRINAQSAAVAATVKWRLQGAVMQERELEIPIRVNKGMGVDAILGKATRKARAWLWGHLSGTELSEGDVADMDVIYTQTGPSGSDDPTEEQQEQLDSKSQYRRVVDFADKASTLDELEMVKEECLANNIDVEGEDYKSLFTFHENRIKNLENDDKATS